MKYIVYILLFFPVWVTAQTYKYIGIEDGLSNRRIFNIQKDAQGYMWFLTNEGMDRYNGKDIKHYKLNKEGTILDAPIRLGWLYTEPHIGIWANKDESFNTKPTETISKWYINYRIPLKQ